MKRDIEELAAREHDVLIIGGGIHGAALAHSCARQGMRVALVEQGDFGQATSANSLKIMHGGLRYLQHLNLKRMRESILARRDMLRLAPHCVMPLPCLIPNYGYGIRGNILMRFALWLNDLIGWDRNAGVATGSRLPAGTILTRTQAGQLLAGISSGAPDGASLWYDALAVNTERLTLSFVQAAVDLGAQAANYAEITDLIFDRGRVSGGVVLDHENERQFTVRARTVVNAAGPWLGKILGAAGLPKVPAWGWAKAVNIVVNKSFWGPYAVGLTGEPDFADKDAVVRKKGRFFFFVPWRGYTMIGTTYKPFAGSPGNLRPELGDIEDLLREVNRMYPPAALTLADVTLVHAGLVPMATPGAESGEEVQLVKETQVIDHGAADSGYRGLYSIRGVKYTTAPQVAIAAGKMLRRYLAREHGWRPESHAKQVANTSEQGDAEISLPPAFHFLVERYGPRAAQVHGYIRKNSRQLSQAPPLYLGEIDYFLTEEMALTLADVVCRRFELASAQCPPEAILQAVARHMAGSRNWDAQRIQDEIRTVWDVFAPLHTARTQC
jgi:glycerol-3-phosphate dehydrogenase